MNSGRPSLHQRKAAANSPILHRIYGTLGACRVVVGTGRDRADTETAFSFLSTSFPTAARDSCHLLRHRERRRGSDPGRVRSPTRPGHRERGRADESAPRTRSGHIVRLAPGEASGVLEMDNGERLWFALHDPRALRRLLHLGDRTWLTPPTTDDCRPVLVCAGQRPAMLVEVDGNGSR